MQRERLEFLVGDLDTGVERLEPLDKRGHGGGVGGAEDGQHLRIGMSRDKQRQPEHRDRRHPGARGPRGPGKGHGHRKPAMARGAEGQRRVMPLGHRPHDGKTETRTGRVGRDGCEPFGGARVVGLGNAGPGILDRQNEGVAPHRKGNVDGIVGRAMAHGVVDQVAQRLSHRHRIGHDDILTVRDVIGIEGQRDVAHPAVAEHFGQRVAHHRLQRDRPQRGTIGTVDDHGVGEQLVGQADRPLGLPFGAHEASAQLCRVGGIHRQREMTLKRGERRAGLVGDVGDEAFGQFAVAVELRDETVDRLEQPADLARGGAFDGRKVAGGTGPQVGLDPAQREQRPPDGEPDEPQTDQRHHRQPRHAVQEERKLLRPPRLERLADLHGDPEPSARRIELPSLQDEPMGHAVDGIVEDRGCL